jgi:hypothetical protein
MRRLEALANVATILVSLLLSAVLIKEFILPQHPPGPSAASQAARGMKLESSLVGVDWARNGRTMVLAISTQCHYCTESAPFFERLWKEKPPSTKLLAVLPQPVAEAQKYLNRERVHVDDVKQANLSSIGVVGTPTLLLVDKTGTVADVWRGKLAPDQEEAVLAALKATPK